MLTVGDCDGLLCDAFGNVFEAFIQCVGALGFVGNDLCAFCSSYSGYRGRRFQTRFRADDLLNVEEQVAQALTDPSEDACGLRLFLDRDRRTDVQTDQALVRKKDVGTTLKRADAVPIEKGDTGVVDARGEGCVDALEPDIPFDSLKLSDRAGRLQEPERRAGNRDRESGHQRGNQYFSTVNIPDRTMLLSFEDAQGAATTFNPIFVFGDGQDFTRHRVKRGIGPDFQLRRSDLKFEFVGKIEGQRTGAENDGQRLGTNYFQVSRLPDFHAGVPKA